VREALVALEIAGFVEVRTGSGAFVTRRLPPAEARQGMLPGAGRLADAGPSPFEIIAARRMVEPAVAAQAAAAATRADLARIAEADAIYERHRAGTHWERLEADRLFHLRIAEATHNAIIVPIVESLWSDMFGPIFEVLSARGGGAAEKLVTMHDHRTILGCIERRDGVGAEAAMLAHLVHAEMKLLRSQAPEAEGAGTEAAAAR
jgi:DNA-binding FadR family transcriptional regulator